MSWIKRIFTAPQITPTALGDAIEEVSKKLYKDTNLRNNTIAWRYNPQVAEDANQKLLGYFAGGITSYDSLADRLVGIMECYNEPSFIAAIHENKSTLIIVANSLRSFGFSNPNKHLLHVRDAFIDANRFVADKLASMPNEVKPYVQEVMRHITAQVGQLDNIMKDTKSIAANSAAVSKAL